MTTIYKGFEGFINTHAYLIVVDNATGESKRFEFGPKKSDGGHGTGNKSDNSLLPIPGHFAVVKGSLNGESKVGVSKYKLSSLETLARNKYHDKIYWVFGMNCQHVAKLFVNDFCS